jgi:ADP-ribosylation factor 2-binding protein
LNEEIEGFNMEKFLTQVEERKDEIDEQIFDLLLSFSDFEAFKETMLFSRAHLVATTPKLKSSKANALGLKDSSKVNVYETY